VDTEVSASLAKLVLAAVTPSKLCPAQQLSWLASQAAPWTARPAKLSTKHPRCALAREKSPVRCSGTVFTTSLHSTAMRGRPALESMRVFPALWSRARRFVTRRPMPSKYADLRCACSCPWVQRVATVPGLPELETMARMANSCGPVAMHLLLQRHQHVVPDVDGTSECGCSLFPRDTWQAFSFPGLSSFFREMFLAAAAGADGKHSLPEVSSWHVM
jgi:hypothetical protein